MTKVAAEIEREKPRSEPVPDRYAPPSTRPGWVADLAILVLAGADRALSPHDVHRRAELVHGQRIARSSIRNALRIASSETDAAIESVGYGSYRLRSQPARALRAEPSRRTMPSAPRLGATPDGGYHRDMSVKQRLHAAVDAMTEPEATAALKSLADASGDPVAWLLDHAPSEAPLDDEVDALARFDTEHPAGAFTLSTDELKQSLGIE